MNDQQKEQIKSTLKSLGWKLIEEIFAEELRKFDNPITYNKKDMEEVGKEYVARVEAKKKVEKILRLIRSYDTDNIKKKITYK